MNDLSEFLSIESGGYKASSSWLQNFCMYLGGYK